MSNSLFEAIIEQGDTKKKTKKQEAIVEAAIKLFAEKGYANTSTAEMQKWQRFPKGRSLNIIVQKILYYFL